MDNKPSFKPPFRPKYETQIKSYVPDAVENKNINNQMFLHFTNGDYFKIKDYITTNNLVINFRDEEYNNVLHKIIQNSTLFENQKIDLVNLAVSNGVDVSASNLYNETPLHWAFATVARCCRVSNP